MMDGELEFLVRVGILEPQANGAVGYELATAPSVAQPDVIDAMAEMIERRLPAGTRGIAFPDGNVNAQLGYALARRASVPLANLYDVEGLGYLDGPLPTEGSLSLVSYVLESPWLVREFAGLCKRRAVTAGLVVAIVDRLAEPTTPPVQSVFRGVR